MNKRRHETHTHMSVWEICLLRMDLFFFGHVFRVTGNSQKVIPYCIYVLQGIPKKWSHIAFIAFRCVHGAQYRKNLFSNAQRRLASQTRMSVWEICPLGMDLSFFFVTFFVLQGIPKKWSHIAFMCYREFPKIDPILHL